MFGSKLVHESPFHELLFLTNLGRNVSKDVVYDAFLDALNESDPEQRTHTMSMILNGLMAKPLYVRPVFERGVKMIQAGEADAILCWSVD